VANLINPLVIGVSIGAILLLVALGLTFTFGQMGVINMAHGEFIMAGAYTAYVLSDLFGRMAIFVALPVAFLVTGLMGLILEVTLIRHFYGRPLDTLLLTWGVSLILQQLARDLFGAPGVQVDVPGWLQGQLTVGGVVVEWVRVFDVLLVAGCVTAIWFYLQRTRQGRRMRAVMQNRELAGVSGIAASRVDQRTFFIGSGLAGIAGVALAPLGAIVSTLGQSYIVDAFLVVIAGGLGQLRGAVFAALALGLLNSFVQVWTDASIAKVVVFVVVIAFLQFRPQGLFVLRTRSLT
jgi:urea transport system permease protein